MKCPSYVNMKSTFRCNNPNIKKGSIIKACPGLGTLYILNGINYMLMGTYSMYQNINGLNHVLCLS